MPISLFEETNALRQQLIYTDKRRSIKDIIDILDKKYNQLQERVANGEKLLDAVEEDYDPVKSEVGGKKKQQEEDPTLGINLIRNVIDKKFKRLYEQVITKIVEKNDTHCSDSYNLSVALNASKSPMSKSICQNAGFLSSIHKTLRTERYPAKSNWGIFKPNLTYRDPSTDEDITKKVNSGLKGLEDLQIQAEIVKAKQKIPKKTDPLPPPKDNEVEFTPGRDSQRKVKSNLPEVIKAPTIVKKTKVKGPGKRRSPDDD